MATRKKTLDASSATEKIRAMVNGSKPLKGPLSHTKLRPGDQPFWDGIIKARATDEWDDADLVVAAQLARTQADIEKQQETLDAEGTVVENARGTQIMNPRVTVLEQLARREMALMRTLRMGGKPAGDIRSFEGKRRAESEARQVASELEDDPLLA